MSGIAFEQLRVASNPGVEDDGSGGLRLKVAYGMSLDSDGIKLNADIDAFKQPVRCKTTANVVNVLTGAPNIVDGVSLATGNRILVADQSTAAQDGLYEVLTVGTGANGVWARTDDAAVGAEAAGWYIPVLEGTASADKLFRVNADLGGATVNTDGWTLSEIGSATASTLAGDGLVVNGSALDVNVGTGLETNADTVRIAAAAAGNGLTGGAGSALSVDVDSETGGNIQGVNVTANGVGLDVAAIAGTNLEADGSANLRIAASAAGNGLAGGGASVLSVDVDSETGGNIQPANLTANGVGVDIAAIAGTGIEADGSANLRIAAAAAGAGLTGGAGSALAVGAGTGITVNADDVAINVGSTVDFSSATPVWTFGNETTAEGLFVTGVPVDGNHVPNKTYVDNLVTGLRWTSPAQVLEYQGTRTVVQINGLAPTAGWAVVSADGGTPTAGTSDLLAAGDVAEYDGTSWKKIVANAGGFVPVDTRLLVDDNGTLFAPLTDGVDEGKYADFDGTSNTPALTAPTDGDALLIVGDNSVSENIGYVWDTTTTTWTQFTGAGQIVAGTGLTKSGNTINAIGGNGITANANDLAVDTDTETGGNIQGVNVTANGVGVDISAIAGTGLEADGSANLRLAAQGNGIAGGAGSTLSVNLDGGTLSLSASGVKVADTGIDTGQLAAGAATMEKIDLRFREEEFAAGSFTNTNPSTADLAVAAIIGPQADFYAECYRNGIADMTNQGNGGAVSTATQFKIDNTGAGSVGRVQVGANIFASGNTYRIKYLSADA